MNYNTQLCKTAWEKKFAHGVLICFLKEFPVAGGRSGVSCEAYVFFLKTVPLRLRSGQAHFFWSVGKGVATEM